MSSSPNLSVMASTSSSTGRKKEINRGSPKTGSTLPVNGDGVLLHDVYITLPHCSRVVKTGC